MKLSELVAAVGDDNVSMQNLDENIISLRAGLQQSKITFVTMPMDLAETARTNRTPQLGFVVWMPREVVQAAFKAHGEQG